MKTTTAVIAALCAALPGMALGQSTTTDPVYGTRSSASAGQSSDRGWTMPYQADFWGHAGLSVGRAELNARCTAGTECDRSDTAWRLYAGGRFNRTFGGEVGYVNFGEFSRAGGETESHGIDLTLIAAVPFGTNQNWSVFGKLGTIYAWNEVSGVGIQTGKDEGFSPRFGLGVQMGITQNWALRADLDQYRVKLADGREQINTFMLGAHYTFR